MTRVGRGELALALMLYLMFPGPIDAVVRFLEWRERRRADRAAREVGSAG